MHVLHQLARELQKTRQLLLWPTRGIHIARSARSRQQFIVSCGCTQVIRGHGWCCLYQRGRDCPAEGNGAASRVPPDLCHTMLIILNIIAVADCERDIGFWLILSLIRECIVLICLRCLYLARKRCG